jgi:diguanylate cyclase (GGDEF)-like protein
MLTLVNRVYSPMGADSLEPSHDLAKAWLLRLVERTPLTDIDELELGLLTTQAAPLIDDILEELNSPSQEGGQSLPAEARERVREFGRLRHGERAPREIPRDLAALQALLIETLRREIPERNRGDFARSVESLAEIFGSIQGELIEGLVRERAGEPRRDELTGLPGHAELTEWMRVLVAENRRYRHPFSVVLMDVQGLGRVNEAYGREAGDRVLAAVATVIRNRIRGADRPFRVGDGEFCVLLPHGGVAEAQQMADRLARVIERSQVDNGPRIAVAMGISSCPTHGDEGTRLLELAEEATYSAKAAGRAVAVAETDGHVSADAT